MSSSPLSLLLAGAAVSTVVGSLVSLLMILNDQSLGVIFNWLLGGFSTATWRELGYGAPMIAVGLAALGILSRPLDALALGDDTARSLGLSVSGFRLAIVLAATLTTAAAVAAAGIVAFVGLVAPHAARRIVGGRSSRGSPTGELSPRRPAAPPGGRGRPWTRVAPGDPGLHRHRAQVGGPFFLLLLRRGTGGLA